MDLFKKGHVKKKIFLYLAIGTNLGILIIFKYLGFFTEIISQITGLFAFNTQFSPLKLILPIGISFYTFQSIGYSLDVYYGVRKSEKHLGYFALFVSFFPQILAGPIGRSTELLPQFHNPAVFSWTNIGYGLQRFIWGLFKKVVIADRLAVYVNDIYGNIADYQGSVLWLGTILYAFQLYADFSGYTDMAIGIARFFGYKLSENFNFPFISKNVTEFWRRWHISLSTWLRDYLFVPLQFSKKKWKKWATIYALFLTFVICGLWHGAKFTFVIFGVLQGLALAYEMFTRDQRQIWRKKINSYFYNFSSWVLTFTFTLVSFVFFRAENTADAFMLLQKQFTSFYDMKALKNFIIAAEGSRFIFSLILVCLFIVLDKFFVNTIHQQNKNQYTLNILSSVLIVIILLFGTFGKVDFIYFQF
ncbi:MAG: MBOAT family O-acyltransferase [Bacteroidia bacterium]